MYSLGLRWNFGSFLSADGVAHPGAESVDGRACLSSGRGVVFFSGGGTVAGGVWQGEKMLVPILHPYEKSV
jgi:hypothetical protein